MIVVDISFFFPDSWEKENYFAFVYETVFAYVFFAKCWFTGLADAVPRAPD